MAVRSRRSLLAKLKECEQLGLGGVLMSDVREALPEPEKAVGRLLEDGAILKITRSDKEEVLFYLNKELSISVDEGEYCSLVPKYVCQAPGRVGGEEV